MVQIVKKPQDFLSVLGTGLGQGVSSGLQNLSQYKQQQAQQNQLSQALKQLVPNSPEVSQISFLPKELQPIALKQLLSAQTQEDYARELGLIGTGEQNQQGKESDKTFGTINGQNINPSKPRLTEKQATQLAKLRHSEKLEQKREASNLAKEQRMIQRDIDKETLPTYQEIRKEAKAAKNNDKRLDRMEYLINQGKLNGPLLSSVIDTISKGIFGLGVDLSGLLTADTQEFNKLSKDFLKEAKSIFGARITDTDLRAFLQTVPTLLQSDEGKKRVLTNLRSFNEAAKVRDKALEEILAENNGIRPRNLDSLIEKRAAPELDKISSEFRTGHENNEQNLKRLEQDASSFNFSKLLKF